MSRVGIFGTGAYGISLSLVANHNNHEVIMWTKFQEECDYILTNHENKVLQGVKIPDNIKVTSDLKDFTDNCDLIVVALPVPFLKECFSELSKYDLSNKCFCLASKGILEKDYLMVYQIYELYIDNPNFSVISGPSFAIDIANFNPICLSLYANTNKVNNMVKEVFINDFFKFEIVDDLVGIELSGAIKNVFAIASGIVHGANYCPSTISLFMSRAIHDLSDILVNFTGDNRLLLSHCAIGDLILTCNSSNSRNYTYGTLLATNRVEAENFLSTHTVEGYNTLKILIKMLDEKNFDIKVVSVLKRIIFDNEDIKVIEDYILNK